MRRTVEVMESCKAQLGLPPGAEDTLAAFPRARQLLQPLQELEQLTRRQTALLEVRCTLGLVAGTALPMP